MANWIVTEYVEGKLPEAKALLGNKDDAEMYVAFMLFDRMRHDKTEAAHAIRQRLARGEVLNAQQIYGMTFKIYINISEADRVEYSDRERHLIGMILKGDSQ